MVCELYLKRCHPKKSMYIKKLFVMLVKLQVSEPFFKLTKLEFL